MEDEQNGFRELFQLDDLDGFNRLDQQEYKQTEKHGRVLILLRVIRRTEGWPAYIAPSNTPSGLLPKLPWPDWVREEVAKWAEAAFHLEAGRNPLEEPSRDDQAAWQHWHDTPAVGLEHAPRIMFSVMGFAGRQGANAWRNYITELHRQERASMERMLRNGGISTGVARTLLDDHSISSPALFPAARRAAAAAAKKHKSTGKPRPRSSLA